MLDLTKKISTKGLFATRVIRRCIRIIYKVEFTTLDYLTKELEKTGILIKPKQLGQVLSVAVREGFINKYQISNYRIDDHCGNKIFYCKRGMTKDDLKQKLGIKNLERKCKLCGRSISKGFTICDACWKKAEKIANGFMPFPDPELVEEWRRFFEKDKKAKKINNIREMEKYVLPVQ
ncbi:hypothetical protein DRP07_00225 [Archaeoglobales archaeon]|nr:MAG: hypothetical protein DRP07_00225 [Archaeoglobales archaeon]